jgi:PilZ domain-containing protein
MSAAFSHDVNALNALPAATPRERPEERRRHVRYGVKSRVTLRWLECGECHEELIRTEDLSRSGARLVVRMPLAEGEVVYVEGWDASFQSRAEVRRVFIGRDGEPRLCIAFLDAELPDAALFVAPVHSHS